MPDPFEITASYEPLDDNLRYCVHCGADCWPERENQRHAADCGFTTGVWAVLEQDTAPGGGYGACSVCHAPFALSDKYMRLNADTNQMETNADAGGIAYPVCLGCASGVAVGLSPGVVDD